MRRTIGLSLAVLFAWAPAMAKEIHPTHHHPQSSAKSKSASAAAERERHRNRHRRAHVRLAKEAATHQRGAHHRAAVRHDAEEAPADQYIAPLRVVGAREVGYAAWYGGREVGRRTASGERLDRVHATAAHRSLPLHSLVRVTNLRNGRSVIATINDRGPVSHHLLIDMSPSAAAELHMIDSGIAQVAVVPVAEAASRR